MAEDYLNKISKISKDANGKSSETDFRDRWRKQLSVVVQSCNSRVIFYKLSKLSKCNFDDFLYNKDVQHFVHCLLLLCIRKLAIVIGRLRVQI